MTQGYFPGVPEPHAMPAATLSTLSTGLYTPDSRGGPDTGSPGSTRQPGVRSSHY